MSANIPEWASAKQREGMDDFYELATEYGYFDISFRKPDYYTDDDDSEFVAILTWGYDTGKEDLGIRKHEIRIIWNHEQYFDHCGDKVDTWQFVFACGDATREMNTEVLFIDLFFFMDGITNTKLENKGE
tara:strand:- start:103 stop:492 length:390 start_codon:yes stop_codon:yes gene_type:complete